MHTATREVAVMDGKACLASFEVRYTFTITKGRKAVTWANAASGFGPAEDATVDITEVEVRWHPKHEWQAVDGHAWDMLTADVPDDWFIAQVTEEAA